MHGFVTKLSLRYLQAIYLQITSNFISLHNLVSMSCMLMELDGVQRTVQLLQATWQPTFESRGASIMACVLWQYVGWVRHFAVQKEAIKRGCMLRTSAFHNEHHILWNRVSYIFWFSVCSVPLFIILHQYTLVGWNKHWPLVAIFIFYRVAYVSFTIFNNNTTITHQWYS